PALASAKARIEMDIVRGLGIRAHRHRGGADRGHLREDRLLGADISLLRPRHACRHGDGRDAGLVGGGSDRHDRVAHCRGPESAAMISITTAIADDLPTLHPVIERAYRGDSARAGWTHEAD